MRRKKSKKAKRAYQQQLAEYEATKQKKAERIAELETIVAQQKAQEAANPQTTGGDYLKELPGYQFRLSEGNRAVEATQSRRNMALSGAALKELSQYNQGFASTEYDKEFNRLMAMTGMGKSADTSLANAVMGLGENTAGVAKQYGADQATYYESLNNAVQSGLRNYGYSSGGKTNTAYGGQNYDTLYGPPNIDTSVGNYPVYDYGMK